ncbi:hypothetical protein F3157_09665 [Virgibacillus dakarensis]|uniref:Uncharacterized protein n=1 Tax=Lentibacillus populi TaxID=1827502 RepID=A0A9W5TV22_9BACI|nr:MULTISPECIES: sporulation protein YpjB [Bacillaceae]MBT2214252.1 hypothetical protein [Virgibacillus dakarensis]MTW85923.1 hypothetical protein [Virgibacillus dakarensis]GGB33374.1 hypothetical protein GCM10011409_08480 [Lentibacillus populi]
MKHLRVVYTALFIGLIIGVLAFLPNITAAMQATISTNITDVKTTNDMTLFYWIIAIVGGLIAITLSYVSFRKYKGEEKKRTKKGPDS